MPPVGVFSPALYKGNTETRSERREVPRFSSEGLCRAAKLTERPRLLKFCNG